MVYLAQNTSKFTSKTQFITTGFFVKKIEILAIMDQKMELVSPAAPEHPKRIFYTSGNALELILEDLQKVGHVYLIPALNSYDAPRKLLHEVKTGSLYEIKSFLRKGMYFSGQNIIHGS